MDRRTMLGVIGASTAGMMLLEGREARADGDHDHHTQAVEDCLKACIACAKSCDEMFNHCFGLVEKGQKEHAHSARMALDCAAFCGMSVCMMGRHSPMMALACSACADACKACAEACAKHDTEIGKRCVEACRDCEKACRVMVSGHKSAKTSE